MTNARNSYQRGNLKAFDFYFEIKKLDGKTSDLFEMLQNSRNVEIIDKYKETVIKIDEAKFIETLCKFSFLYSPNEETILNIVNYVCKTINKEKLRLYLKNITLHYKNRFYFYIEKNIA